MEKKEKSLKDIKNIPPTILLKIIEKAKQQVEIDDSWKKMCKSWGYDSSIIYDVPMYFKDLDVSASTIKGVVYLNYKMLEDGFSIKDISYLIHELTHIGQQWFGDEATQSSDDGDYLSNPFEQESFQNQISFIADHLGEEEAEKYTDDLLEYHDKDGKEEQELKDTLMSKVAEKISKKYQEAPEDAPMGEIAFAPQRLDKVPSEKNTNFEETILKLLSSHFRKGKELTVSEINLIKGFIDKGYYEKVFRYATEGEVFRGMSVPKEWLKQFSGFNEEILRGSAKINYIFNPRSDTHISSSWSRSLAQARLFADSTLEPNNYQVIMVANIEDNPQSFLETNNALYRVKDFISNIGENECLALGTVKVNKIIWSSPKK